MKISILKNKLICIILLFSIYITSIWTPFFLFYQKSQLPEIENLENIGYFIDDKDFDKLLTIDSWTADLIEPSGSSAQWLKNSQERVFYNGNKNVFIFPFNHEHLSSGNSSWLLSIHSLSAVKTMLKKFIETDKQEYLINSISYLKGYIEYEKNNNFSESFVFNDHAVSARVYNTIFLWRHYRHSAIKNTKDTRTILSYIYELNSLLKNSTFYNHKTNHGTMQNVALILSATVFPDLPGSEEWGKTGKQRLEKQIGYLISPEGFLLEHSFGYQPLMISLLEAVKNYGEIDKNYHSTYIINTVKKMKQLLFYIIRTDGTIPAIGDTSAGKKHKIDRYNFGLEKNNSINIYPVSGFSVIDKKFEMNQCYSSDTENSFYLTLFWSNYDNHGHKHWDDMSIDLWGCETQWWRNIGYVPYWHPLRKKSETWLGSNAPHLEQEGAPSANSAEILLSAESENIDYIQLVRKLEQGNIYRDILRFKGFFIAHDSFLPRENTGKIHTLETNWTMDHQKRLYKNKNNSFIFYDDEGNTVSSQILTEGERPADIFSMDPETPLGWLEHKGNIFPATTIRARASGLRPFTTMVSQFNSNTIQKSCSSNHRIETHTDNTFTLRLNSCDELYRISNDKNFIKIEHNGDLTKIPIIKIDNKFKGSINEVNKNTTKAFKEYGDVFKPLKKYRLKVSLIGIAAIILSLSIYIAIRLSTFENQKKLIMNSIMISWALMIVWVNFVYF